MNRKIASQHSPEPSLPAVIVAAGEGYRLQGGNGGIPKPLTRVLGLTLLERAVLSCREAGIQKCYVVTGCQGEKLRPLIEELGPRTGISLQAVENPNWGKGNGASVLAAAPFLSGPFLVVMCDHLFDPDILRRLVEAKERTPGCLLAVDLYTDQIANSDDATRVRLDGQALISIGKGITPFDALDTGLFLFRPTLFEALERADRNGDGSLTGGVRELIQNREMQAVEIRGRFWLDVDTPRDLKHARRILLEKISKPSEDGFVSRWLNRPVSRRISQLLARTGLPPNAITVLSFLVLLGGAFLFSMGQYVWTVLAGLLVQTASVLDGCDGEVARLKFRTSRFGAWFDTVLDRYGDTAIALGIIYGYWLVAPGKYVWLGGTLALTGLILPSYLKKEYVLRYRCQLPCTVVDKLLKRDTRLFTFFVGACLNRPFEALILVGLLSHLGIAWTFLTVLRRKNALQAERKREAYAGLIPRGEIIFSTPLRTENTSLERPVGGA